MSQRGFSLRVDLRQVTVWADRPISALDGCLVAWVGHLAGDPPDTAARLVSAYRARGATFSAGLLGQYAGIIVDPTARRVLLFQDSLGLRTLYYAVDGSRLSVAATLGALARLLGDTEIEPAYFAQLITDGLPPHHVTPLRGVQRLSLGTTQRFDGERQQSLRPWSPTPAQIAPNRDDAERLRALLDEAVDACLPQSGEVGCELSGGLDSTSVYTTLMRTRPDAHAITLVSGSGLAGDDEAYAGHVVETSGGRWHCLDIDHYPPHAGLPALLVGEPGDERLAMRQSAYRDILERERIAVMLTGGGGDLMFGYRGIPPIHLADPLRAGHLLGAINGACTWSGQQGGTRPWTHFFARYGVQPAWRHLRRQSMFTDRDWRPPRWLAGSFARQYGLDRAPARQQAPRLTTPSTQFLWEGAYRIATLEASSGFRQHLAADTRFPLFHRPLVEFMLGLNWALRDSGVRGDVAGDRVLQRAALADRLPLRVAGRQTKGSDQQAREQADLRRVDLLERLTRNAQLVARGWVEPAAWRAAVERARFGVYDKLGSFDAAVASELWLRIRDTQSPAPPPVLHPCPSSG